MSKPRLILSLLSTYLMLLASAAEALVIETVTVGNPGNPADSTGFGSVAQSYRIGKYEITNAQYAEFLNSVAASDRYDLYHILMGANTQGGIVRRGSSGTYTYSVRPTVVGVGPGGTDYSYADKGVMFVNWYDTLRFVNWLHNGQGDGNTEDGAYTLLGGTPTPTNALSIRRSENAQWFVPTEDEWYKAAYYDGTSGVYYNYPTGTDAAPNNNLPSADTGNSANFNPAFNEFTTGDPNYPQTPVGAYTLSSSPYGTFDQGGNLAEWTESSFFVFSARHLRGGSWGSKSSDLESSFRSVYGADDEDNSIGFRVAARIPEPTSLLLVALAASQIAGKRTSFRSQALGSRTR